MNLIAKNIFEEKVFRFFELVMSLRLVPEEETNQPYFRGDAINLVVLGHEIEMMIRSGEDGCSLEEYTALEDQFADWFACWGW